MPVPHRIIISRLGRAPRFLAEPFARINAALRVLQAIANMEGRGGIKITKSENNWVVDASGVQGTGDGVPEGYAEEEFTICEDGEPVKVFLLVRREE
jgi:hypothetical protein